MFSSKLPLLQELKPQAVPDDLPKAWFRVELLLFFFLVERFAQFALFAAITGAAKAQRRPENLTHKRGNRRNVSILGAASVDQDFRL